MRGDRALANSITILRTIKLPTNNAEYTPYSILIIIGKLTGWVATIYMYEDIKNDVDQFGHHKP